MNSELEGALKRIAANYERADAHLDKAHDNLKKACCVMAVAIGLAILGLAIRIAMLVMATS